MNNIITGKEAEKTIVSAINKINDIVKLTLGPKKRNIIISRSYDNPLITNDGVTIANSVYSTNKFENTVINIIKEASKKTNIEVGDGTTTTIILASSIYKLGLKYIDENKNILMIQNGIKEAKEKVIEYINSNTIKIKSNDEIKQVAYLSSNDIEISNLIGDIYEKIPNNPHIIIEDSNIDESYIVYKNGFEIKEGPVDKYMLNGNNETLYNSYILLIRGKISHTSQISNLLTTVIEEEKSIVIIADDFSKEVINDFIVNKVKKVINIIAVKNPNTIDKKDDLLSDLSAVTNAQIIDEKLNKIIENINISDLGTIKTCIVKKENILLESDMNEKIDNQISLLENLELKDDFEYEYNLNRIANLKNTIAIIKLGASTNISFQDKKLRMEDAINATKSAINEGVVIGGGITFLKVIDTLQYNNEDDKKIGFEIIKESLLEPFKQIIKNSNMDFEEIYNHVSNNNVGFNSFDNSYFSLDEKSIIDPKNVLISALKNAVSVSSLLLTTNAIILEEEILQKEEEMFF